MISVAGDLSDDDVVDRSAILTHVAPGLAAPGLGTADLLAVVAGGMGGRSSSEHNTNIPLYSRVKKMFWKLGTGKGERVKRVSIGDIKLL